MHIHPIEDNPYLYVLLGHIDNIEDGMDGHCITWRAIHVNTTFPLQQRICLAGRASLS